MTDDVAGGHQLARKGIKLFDKKRGKNQNTALFVCSRSCESLTSA